MNHTCLYSCLYSPAAERHIIFRIAEGRRRSWPERCHVW